MGTLIFIVIVIILIIIQVISIIRTENQIEEEYNIIYKEIESLRNKMNESFSDLENFKKNLSYHYPLKIKTSRLISYFTPKLGMNVYNEKLGEGKIVKISDNLKEIEVKFKNEIIKFNLINGEFFIGKTRKISNLLFLKKKSQ